MKTFAKTDIIITNGLIDAALKPLEIRVSIPPMRECPTDQCFRDKSLFGHRDHLFDTLPPVLEPSAELAVTAFEALREFAESPDYFALYQPFSNLFQIENLVRRSKYGEETGLALDNNYANMFFLKSKS